MYLHRFRFRLLNVMTSHHIFVLQVFEERAQEHDKFGGDPEHPHKLHIVTRVKSTMRRPFWEMKVVKSLGLMKVGCHLPLFFKLHYSNKKLSNLSEILIRYHQAHEPRIHKNTPSVNNLLKIIKHLVR